MLNVGGKKKTKFKMLHGMPETHSMAGMPQKGSPGTMEHGLTDYDYMPTIPGKRYGYKTLKGMPNTRQLNGGWGADHSGRIGGGTKSLLANKRNSIVEDPQDRRDKGKVRLSEQDPSGFLKDKVMPNASVTCTDAGFCLKGEEDRTTPSNGTFYGMKDGKRGWYPVSGVAEDAAEGNASKASKISIDGATKMDVIVDVRWDIATHQLLMTKRTVIVVPEVPGEKFEPEEQVIFTATPIWEELQ